MSPGDAFCTLEGPLMPEDNKIVAVGLMTEADLRSWGHNLRRVYSVDENMIFDELICAIDKAELNNRTTKG